MNKKQKQMIVLLAAVTLFSLSELFPPLSYKDEHSRQRSAGYHFFYHPPETVEVPNEPGNADTPPDERFRSYRVGTDYLRLIGQRVILLFAMVGLFLLLEERRSKLKTVFGVLFLCFGFVVLGFYSLYVSITG